MTNIKCKRYVLMGGSKYYACGGFEDYLNSYDDKDKAIAALDKYIEEEGDLHWAHVADLETGNYWSKGQAEAGIARLFK